MSEFRHSSVPDSASAELAVRLERDVLPIDAEIVPDSDATAEDIGADRLAEIMRRRFSETGVFRPN